MKVISLKEPYATLIQKKHKRIETRSWKTSYRGELYIHASKSIMSDPVTKYAYQYVEKKDLQCGYIIAKCKLVDCIEMTEEWIREIKENNPKEYQLGIYEVGRYAWILEEIEEIQPIPANGKLNIWDYKEEKNELRS